jgi:hypothetical protein
MKRINARIIALGLLAAGLLLGTIAVVADYGESNDAAVSCKAHHRQGSSDAQPRS